MFIRRLLVCSLVLLALVSAGPFGAALSGRDAATSPGRLATSEAAMTAKTGSFRHCQRGIAGLARCSIDKTIVTMEGDPRSDKTGWKLAAAETLLPLGQHGSKLFRPPRLS
jgi:hypothetical protein